MINNVITTVYEGDEARAASERELKLFFESIVLLGPDGAPLPEPRKLPPDISIDYDNDRAEEED